MFIDFILLSEIDRLRNLVNDDDNGLLLLPIFLPNELKLLTVAFYENLLLLLYALNCL